MNKTSKSKAGEVSMRDFFNRADILNAQHIQKTHEFNSRKHQYATTYIQHQAKLIGVEI